MTDSAPRDKYRGRPWPAVAILVAATALCLGLAYGATWLGGDELARQVALFANPLILVIALALCWRHRP